jgi:hypothetical protein
MDADLQAFLDRCDDVLADWDGGADAMRYRATNPEPERQRPAHQDNEPDVVWRVWFPWTC